MTKPRTVRARQTEDIVAFKLQCIYPDAKRIPASLPGVDILNTPGIAIEVKARRDLALSAWLRQAAKNARDGDLPIVAHRPDGFGPETVDHWPVTMPMWVFIEMLKRGGFGG